MMNRLRGLFLAALCSLTFAASAMQGLTPALKATLRAAALAEPTLTAGINAGTNDPAVLAWFNAAPASACWVARSDVKKSELYKLTSGGGVFWSWALFKANSAAEQTSWREMFEGTSADILDMSQANVLAGMASILGGANANTTHALVIGRRLATNAEKALATSGTGWSGASGAVCSSTNPAVMPAQGLVTIGEIPSILRP